MTISQKNIKEKKSYGEKEKPRYTRYTKTNYKNSTFKTTNTETDMSFGALTDRLMVKNRKCENRPNYFNYFTHDIFDIYPFTEHMPMKHLFYIIFYHCSYQLTSIRGETASFIFPSISILPQHQIHRPYFDCIRINSSRMN